jgi:hypothetical protein
MIRARSAVLTVLAAGLAAPVAAPAAEPLRVHVRPGPKPTLADAERKALEKEASSASKRAEQERKTVEKTIAAAHGKRMAGWPAEARARYDAASQAELMAILEHHVVKTDADDLRKSANEVSAFLGGAAGKPPVLAVVDSPDGADLVVEVLARRAKTSFPAAAFMLFVKVAPAGGGSAERFAGTSFGQVRTKDAYLGQIMGVQKLAGFVSTAHAYSEAEPYWIVEVIQQGTGYYAPAQTAAEAIAAFAAGMTEKD